MFIESVLIIENFWLIISILTFIILIYFYNKDENKQKEEWKEFEKDIKITSKQRIVELRENSKIHEEEMKKIFNESNIIEDLNENTIFFKNKIIGYGNEISFIELEDLDEEQAKTFFDDFEIVSRLDFIDWLKNDESKSNKVNKTKVLKYDLTETEFKENINSQLNNCLKRKTRIFWAGDEHRTHPWSLQPGGSTVVVLFKDKKCIGYDKVKRPDRYTKKISSDYVTNNLNNKQYKTLEEYINSIYLAKDKTIELKKIWDTNMNLSPWEILEKYRIK